MAEVIIYSTGACGYCTRAKMLLEKKGASYEEIRIDLDPDKRAEMVQRSNGARSVPQIFINGEHIGGFDNLMMLEFDEELDPMLRDEKPGE